MEMTMYDTLLQLPLFQGLGEADLTNILSKVKFSFQKYQPEETIAVQGEKCNQLMFFLNGQLLSVTEHPNFDFCYTEVFRKPMLIEPYALFGLHPRFHSSYKARTESNILGIDKRYILTELMNYDIFRINFLNILSNYVQIMDEKISDSYPNGVRNKIIHFFCHQAKKAEGEKIVQIKMEELAEVIDETRINVSRELNLLQKDGLIQLKRKIILIPALEKLSALIY